MHLQNNENGTLRCIIFDTVQNLWREALLKVIQNDYRLIHAKQRLLRRRKKSLQKFLELEASPKVIYIVNSLVFGKACEDQLWNHCTATPHRSETNGIAERAVRRVKEGTPRYFCNLVWMKGGGQILWNAVAICEKSKTSWQTGNSV